MHLTFRYRLEPSKAQYALLADVCERQRRLYNAALQERREAWKRFGVRITRNQQQASLTEIRSFDADYSELSVIMSRWTIYRLDEAFTGFFNRIKRGEKPGYPRFRAKDRWRSFGFAEWSGVRIKDGRIHFRPFATGIRLMKGRPLPDGAKPKLCTFTLRGRHWHVAVVVDVPAAPTHRFPDAAVGLDFGVARLLTTDAGERVDNIRPRDQLAKRLRRAQRKLSRAKLGSYRRRKTRAAKARIEAKIARVRTNHLHQVSARLAQEYALIAVESLKLKNMTGSARGTVSDPGRAGTSGRKPD